MPAHAASKEEILRHCRSIIQRQGLEALNMRTVAEECGTALGSLYYHFPSKNALVIATIESVWSELFCLDDSVQESSSFAEYVRNCYGRLYKGIQKYPNFFTIHSVSVSEDGRSEAKETMNRYMDRILNSFREVLTNDRAVRTDAFDATFTMDSFLRYVLESMTALLMRGHGDCDVLVEMIRRSLYEKRQKGEMK